MFSVGRKIRWLTAVAAALTGAVALPMAGSGLARADQVRQKEQWVLGAIDVPAAWRISQGRGVLVAVIDSGVDASVSDLAGSVVPGPDFTGVHTPESSPGWGAHGTWMASLIAGHGHGHHNTDGVIGVAPQARVMSIRVITDRLDPGYAAYQAQPPGRGQLELARGIRYAVSHGAGVISMSLGYVAPSLVVRAALQYAVNHNVVVVASSGNSGDAQTATGRGHAPYSFPADYPGVIGVAATNPSGLPAYFSSENLSVQVAAPGVNVPAQGRGSHYWLVSGTSPACALTAGVAALIRSKYPKLSAADVRRAITSSTVNRPPGGYDDQVGFGSLDAARALASARRLARPARVRGSAVRGSQTGYFGTGRLPVDPVAARGHARLFELAGVAALCLLLTLVFTWRFATGAASIRKARKAAGRAPAFGGPAPVFGGPAPGFGGPAPGFGGPVADVRYPPDLYAGQPGPGGPGFPGGAVGPGGPGLPGGSGFSGGPGFSGGSGFSGGPGFSGGSGFSGGPGFSGGSGFSGGPASSGGPTGLGGSAGHGLPDMAGHADPGHAPWPPGPGAVPGSAGWSPPSAPPGPEFGSPYTASTPTVTPSQQQWPGASFAPQGGAFTPTEMTGQQPWPGPDYPSSSGSARRPGPGHPLQMPAESSQGPVAPSPGFGPADAAFTAPAPEQPVGPGPGTWPGFGASPGSGRPVVPDRGNGPGFAGSPPPERRERQAPPTEVHPSPLPQRRQSQPDGQPPDQQRNAPANRAPQREGRGTGRRQGIVDPVLSWLDRTYPVPEVPDRASAESKTLPKRNRPAPSEPGQPSQPGQPGRTSAYQAIRPDESVPPLPNAPAGPAGIQAEPPPLPIRRPTPGAPAAAPSDEASQPRTPPQSPEAAWDPWSPSGRTKRRSPPQGGDAHDTPT